MVLRLDEIGMTDKAGSGLEVSVYVRDENRISAYCWEPHLCLLLGQVFDE